MFPLPSVNPSENKRPITTPMRQPGSLVPSPYPVASAKATEDPKMSAMQRKLEQLDSPNFAKQDISITGKTSDGKSVQKKVGY